MFYAKQFRDLILFPTLHALDLYSDDVENLLVMTMAHESNGGEFLAQISGPALGIYQMEKITFDDLWNHMTDLDSPSHKYIPRILNACNLLKAPIAEEMIGNLYLSTAMARIFYLRVKESIPSDLMDMAVYCKKYWNSPRGKATPRDYFNAYHRFEND